MTWTLRAHFDGNVIVPDEPVDLPIDSPLEILLKPAAGIRTESTGSGPPPPQSPFPPNEAALAALREIEQLQRGMNPKPGGDSQVYIREARSGAMYGYQPTE